MTRLVTITTLLLVVGGTAHAQDQPDSAVFERVFGIPRTLPADMVEQVKALPEGERLLRDTTGDGAPGEAWYLDTAFRHTVAPLLVRYVDRSGALAETGRPSLHSGTYFWDHGATGYIDVVTVYQDDNGDGNLDQMGIFYDKKWPDGRGGLTVWWAVDVGGDNRLWFDVNGNYYQDLCQWRTHFSGDELFYQFRLTDEDERWVNVWEDPFAFYDPDGDGASEVVVRISAIGDDVQNLRYSIDADDDAYGKNLHDYDFSITAFPPESGLAPDPAMTAPMTVLGIETHPVLTWENTMAFAQNAAWGKAMLTWDEINSNTDENPDRDPNERWEGVLNHASKHGDFAQVGGPPSSAFNKRVEVAAAPASPLRLYYDGAGRRFHLLGADYGYLDVDFDLDGEVDAAYTWKDTDGDGVLDVRAADVNADGTVDFEAPLHGNQGEYPLTFEAFKDDYPAALDEVLAGSRVFIDAALAALGETPPEVAEVVAFYAGPLAGYHPERELGLRIRNTPAGARLYMDLARDRLFVALKRAHGGGRAWPDIERAYLAGDHDAAAELVYALAGAEPAPDDAVRPLVLAGTTYTRRAAVTVANGHDRPLHDWPVVAAAGALREKAPDFNPANCVVVHGGYWLAWRAVPHQVDDWDLDGRERLSFMADLPARAQTTFYVYYAPEGAYDPGYPHLTNAVLDTPAYVAWESDAGAFRNYTGQFDFYGLHQSRLLPREERLLYPLIDVNHHIEHDWGMDALHVNKTSGLGGLTLYLDGEPHPVQSPAGVGHVHFEYKVVGSGPVRAAADIIATNVLPGRPEAAFRLRCFIYAGRRESEVRVALPEGLEAARIAPGVQPLPEHTPFANALAGCIGTWGWQGDDIGEISLGVIVPPDLWDTLTEHEGEQRVQCRVEDAGFRYWIIGAWRRGMQYPVAPTVENWRRELAQLAEELNNPPVVTLE